MRRKISLLIKLSNIVDRYFTGYFSKPVISATSNEDPSGIISDLPTICLNILKYSKNNKNMKDEVYSILIDFVLNYPEKRLDAIINIIENNQLKNYLSKTIYTQIISSRSKLNYKNKINYNIINIDDNGIEVY